jgi:hypothetical protein
MKSGIDDTLIDILDDFPKGLESGQLFLGTVADKPSYLTTYPEYFFLSFLLFSIRLYD